MAPCLFSCFRKRASSAVANHQDNDNAATEVKEDEDEEETSLAASEGPVVVELFSSQGCATSHEAELLFSRLGRGDFEGELPPLILLAFHVDYWDHMGWKDPFGSSQWTVRQKTYVEAFRLDTIFTPHLVVNGRAQGVANDRDAVFTAVKSVSRFPSLSFRATFERPRAETLQVSLTRSIKKDESGGKDIVIMVALFECGLLTRCEDGQNRDTVLANDYVVRRLERLCDGEVKDVVAENGKKKTVSSRTINFSLWETFNSCKCGIAIFVQNSSHQILGSQKFQLPPHI